LVGVFLIYSFKQGCGCGRKGDGRLTDLVLVDDAVEPLDERVRVRHLPQNKNGDGILKKMR
jgi:hypothetical protein